MGLKNSNFYKVEMDDSGFFEFDKSMWSTHCLTYLSECISANTDRKDIIATCGGLPLPTHPEYLELEKEHTVSFIHTLVLTRTIDDYKKNIVERKLTNKTEELIKNYNWRKSTINLYDNIIFNERDIFFAPIKENG